MEEWRRKKPKLGDEAIGSIEAPGRLRKRKR